MHSNVATAPQFEATWAVVHKPTLEMLQLNKNSRTTTISPFDF
jgi:hypothetical protein